jgi:hypothetical protein
MKKLWLKYSVLLALASAASAVVEAQQIVHAVSGVVTSVDPATTTIIIETNDDSLGIFRYEKKLKSDIVFDKDVRTGATEPGDFNKVGNHVVAYYFAGNQGRTIVAIKDFGPTGLKSVSGTVVKNKHHVMTITTDTGATMTFDIAKDASAETPGGVVSGFKFDADQGTKVTVRYTETGETKTAEFIRNAFG